MKNLILSITFFLSLGLSAAVLADKVVVKEYGAPIVVEKDVYTVRDPDYYYYPGHRCYVKERPEIAANFLGLRAGIGGGKELYCYPD